MPQPAGAGGTALAICAFACISCCIGHGGVPVATSFWNTKHATVRRNHHRLHPPRQARGAGGDGQVTLGNIVIKASARKVRKLHGGKVLAGFAGGTADAFTLIERFEAKLQKHQGNLLVSAVELARTGAPTACCAGSKRC